MIEYSGVFFLGLWMRDQFAETLFVQKKSNAINRIYVLLFDRLWYMLEMLLEGNVRVRQIMGIGFSPSNKKRSHYY
jgi:hypothetical protein